MSVEDQRLNIDNDNCIIVEFVNENNSLCMAYKSWLVDKKLRENVNKIKSCIEKRSEKLISWPTIDVSPAEKMKKQLAKMKSWDADQVVRILAYGCKFSTH